MQTMAIIGVILAFIAISIKRLETEENKHGKCDL
jgi:mannose/fructose/N-acetylgalactosamine-specific phosphotransferase system component IIC